MSKSVAVLLSGCGNRDGAEIHESVMTALALKIQGFEVVYFSVDREFTTTAYSKRPTSTQTRNVLEESARIARGEIRDLKDFRAQDYCALAIPGGMGAVKNFSNFATAQNGNYEVVNEVRSAVSSCLQSKKPILAVCIAPVLVGMVAAQEKIQATLTLGESVGPTTEAVIKMGHRIENTSSKNFVADATNQIVSTPAFMNETSVDEIWSGIQAAVLKLKTWTDAK